MKMSIHRALGEIKTIKARVESKTTALVVADAGLIKNLTPEAQGDIDKHPFVIDQRAAIQSITDLIARHDTIKAAIVESNAVTKVRVNGVEYTVAGALEHKTGITRKKALIAKLRSAYYTVAQKVSTHNAKAQKESESTAERTVNGQTESRSEEYRKVYDFNMEMNEAVVIAPSDIRSLIEEMEEEVIEFEKEIDIVLSESNIQTMIEV